MCQSDTNTDKLKEILDKKARGEKLTKEELKIYIKSKTKTPTPEVNTGTNAATMIFSGNTGTNSRITRTQTGHEIQTIIDSDNINNRSPTVDKQEGAAKAVVKRSYNIHSDGSHYESQGSTTTISHENEFIDSKQTYSQDKENSEKTQKAREADEKKEETNKPTMTDDEKAKRKKKQTNDDDDDGYLY